MSKGIGSLQKQILSSIQSVEGEFQENRLLWSLARQNKKLIIKKKYRYGYAEGSIDNSFYKSFKRSIQSADGKFIVQVKRKIYDFKELVEYYPYKTKRLELMILRKKLLPTVSQFFQKHNWHKYNLGEVENHLLSLLKESAPDDYGNAVKDWNRIERELYTIVVHESENQQTFLNILIKGRQYFVDNNLNYRISLNWLIKKLSANKIAPQSPDFVTYERIKTFYSKYFNYESLKYNWMKSQIYSGFQIGSHIKEELKRFLLDRHEKFITSLPGHDDGYRKSAKGKFKIGYRFEAKYNRDFEKLIDTHAFTPYKFLSIVRPPIPLVAE